MARKKDTRRRPVTVPGDGRDGVLRARTKKRPAEPPTHGMRLSVAKREEREQRQRTLRWKRIGIVSVFALLGVGVVWALYAFLSGPALNIETVEVTGLAHLSEVEVLKRAALDPDATLTTLNARAMKKRISADPWVESVAIRRRLPDTLRIEVTERRAAAVVDAGDAEQWVISDSGVWLGPRSAAESATLTVRDLPEVVPAPGQRADDPVLLNAVRIATGLSDELRAMTRVITAPAIEKTAVITTDNVEVFIGEAADLELKDRIARELLEREKGRVVYINVRVVSSPTWRGLDP